jgi:hypothetical protein
VSGSVSEQVTTGTAATAQLLFLGQIPRSPSVYKLFTSSSVCGYISEIYGLLSVDVLVINPAFVKVK